MDCEHRDQLLDLVYGELEDAEASVLRRQAEACEGCRDELVRLDQAKRLADQLVLEPMPLTARNLIMAAAEQAAAKNAEPEPEREGWLAGVLTWIRETAAKPQLAMAVVMLGVVAVGIYFVPGDELAQQEIETSLVADPETEIQTAEHDSVERELDEEALPAEDRDEEDENQEQHQDEVRDPEVDSVETVRPDEPETEAPRPDTTRRTDPRTRTTRRDPTPAEIAAARREGESADLEQALDLADVQNREEGARVVTAQQRVTTDAPTPVPTTEMVATRTMPQQQSSNTIEPMRGNRATYERAMSEYRGGDFRSAAEEFERVVRSPDDDVRQLLPSALHHLARSHRRRGACSTALQHFNRLFQLYPAYAQLPQALLEAADCHRREGSLSEARTLLHRAAGYASTEAAAERELRRIETIQRAQRRSAPAPAQADSVESAY